jgi:hypothetical protein
MFIAAAVTEVFTPETICSKQVSRKFTILSRELSAGVVKKNFLYNKEL